MKIVLFGTGDYYRKYRKWFRDEDITALLDNDRSKQGKVLDGAYVYAPEEIGSIEFDWIVILSVNVYSMEEQLRKAGVDDNKVIRYSELISHINLIKPSLYTGIYANERLINNTIQNLSSDNCVLFMSHNLDINGASMALLYAALCTKNDGMDVVFVSWNDGDLRRELEKEDIPVIIEPNLEINTAANTQWVRYFSKVVCNTLNYYQFLSERDDNNHYVWWLHDPDFFYRSIDTERLKRIDLHNISLYAAGSPAIRAVKHYLSDVEVKSLHYGIPDLSGADIRITPGTDNKLEIAVIANIQEYKGQDILVEAFSYLAQDDIQSLHIDIVGNTESAYAKKLRERIAEKRIGSSVELKPFMSRREVSDLLGTIDLLICPSREDVMPVSVCEAMQRRIPVIVSDSTGTADLLTDAKDGLIFRSGDAADLAKQIRWCVQNREELKKIGENARKIYERYFSMDSFRQNWRGVLSECFGAGVF